MPSSSLKLESKGFNESDSDLNFSEFMGQLAEERDASKSISSNHDDMNNDMSLDLNFLGAVPEKGPMNDTEDSANKSNLRLGDLPSESNWSSGFFNSFRRRMSSTRMMTSFRRMSSIKMMEDPDKPRKKRVRFKKFEKIFNY
eukprot:CAMPEP_0116139908 /NCGR_PEP_ID=MMETSP0329-20121206/13558_1 /TAXON_ID=697910 /ORGANISM="Pseudo-nitzschia arenysensis, Strain B593" /LENGTH=141 /DNA_ID=CAMNT_0003634973 /DNA_START=391 /DNA_END=816 /DNA_ORIENTATION=+